MKRFAGTTNGILLACLLAAVGMAASPAGKAPAPAGQDAGDRLPFVRFSIENMDRSVDPRVDFYRYACGGWVDRTEILPTQRLAAAALPIVLNTDARLRRLAAEAAADANRDGAGRIVGDFYLSAMNTDLLNTLDLRPIEADLAAIDGVQNAADLARVTARIASALGSTPLVAVGVSPDAKQTDRNALHLGAGMAAWKLMLNQVEYESPQAQGIRDLYRNMLARLFELAGDDATRAGERAQTALEIEQQLAAGAMTPVELADYNATYHKMAFTEAQALIPSFDLTALLTTLGVDIQETVIVPDLKALAATKAVLEARTMDDIRTLLRAHVLVHSAAFLSDRFHDTVVEFHLKKAGVQQASPRAIEVVQALQLYYGQPISRLYVAEYFPPEYRKPILDMAGRIKDAFRQRMMANPWLTETTRKRALAKLDLQRVYVGYPETENDWIDYSDLQTSPQEFFGNVRKANEKALRMSLANLGKPPKRMQFAIPLRTTPVAMNAGLYPQYNVIDVTAVFLQPPYFDPDADPAVNFGAIGAVIGHEMTHAFDSKGRNFDEHNNLQGWWLPEDVAEFQRRADVIVEQYNGYEVQPGLHVNGELTLAENIADLGALNMSYTALQNYMKENGRLPDIDGLTPEQRFFLAWAQAWMTKARPEAERVQIATDPHAPSQIRAFAPALHMPEFYEAFGIKEGDPMWLDPSKRTRIW